MRKHSDLFPLVLGGAGFALFAILQNAYQNALQAWVVEWLKQHGYQEQLALLVSGLLPLVPSIGLAVAVIWFIYWYVKKDFEKNFETGGNFREIQAQHDMASALREHTMELARHTASNNPLRRAAEEQFAQRMFGPPEKKASEPALTVKVHEGAAFDGDAPSRDCWLLLAELRGGAKSLSNCQLILETGHGHTHVISERFDLRSGEPKMVTLIRYRKTSNPQECRAFIPMCRGDGRWTGGNLLLGPDRYTIKVLSQEAKPATFDVQLSKHPTSVGDWILEEVPHERKT